VIFAGSSMIRSLLLTGANPWARLSSAGSSRSSRGFTLLEILVALAVLSLVAATAIKTSGNAINNVLYLKQQTMAHWVAMNKAAELELTEQWQDANTRTGVETLADGQWPWAITGHDTPDQDMRRFEIAVWANSDAGEPLSTLTVFLGRK
jgi:general secretion pathway protein I